MADHGSENSQDFFEHAHKDTADTDRQTRRIDRRQALAFGTVSLGRCWPLRSDRVETTDGGATVEPEPPSPDTASRFGDESNCTLTPR